jgi:predicted GNAT family acetyltransferase
LEPLFREGNERDEGPYVRACLEQGPSIVVEIGGQPVSWSLTHLGGAVGRIYTPPEHRGKGYGKSLTALHVDVLLGLRGIAVASVRVDNAASYRMFQALGAHHIRGPMTWSTLLWD